MKIRFLLLWMFVGALVGTASWANMALCVAVGLGLSALFMIFEAVINDTPDITWKW